MGGNGGNSVTEHGGHGHAAHGHDHHHAPRINKSVIFYDNSSPAHELAKFKAPDWRIYKVADAPDLAAIEHRLAALGLKDPWLRFVSFNYGFVRLKQLFC
jgi:hypothetical protein